MNYESDKRIIDAVKTREVLQTSKDSITIENLCETALKYIEKCEQLERDNKKLIDRKVPESSYGTNGMIYEDEVYTMVLKSGVKIIVDMHLADYIESFKAEKNEYAYFEDSGFVKISEIAYIGNRKVL